MKFQDFLSESQVNELGIMKNIQKGIQGAVSGYKANQAQRQGQAHSGRIVDILKKEFMQQVGGGSEATYQNLIDFLTNQGLDFLDTIPDPTKSTEPAAQDTAAPADQTTAPVEPTTSAPSTSTTPSAPTLTPGAGSKALGPKGRATLARLGKQKQGRENPQQGTLDLNEAVGTLNNNQIDTIIKAAVQKNYSRIRNAQAGGSGLSGGSAGTSSSATVKTPSASNSFSDPDKLSQEWSAYIASGGKINRQLRKLVNVMSQTIATASSAPVKKKTAPSSKPAPTPEPAVNLSHPADDNPNIGLGSNESVVYSKFLGKSI